MADILSQLQSQAAGFQQEADRGAAAVREFDTDQVLKHGQDAAYRMGKAQAEQMFGQEAVTGLHGILPVIYKAGRAGVDRVRGLPATREEALARARASVPGSATAEGESTNAATTPAATTPAATTPVPTTAETEAGTQAGTQAGTEAGTEAGTGAAAQIAADTGGVTQGAVSSGLTEADKVSKITGRSAGEVNQILGDNEEALGKLSDTARSALESTNEFKNADAATKNSFSYAQQMFSENQKADLINNAIDDEISNKAAAGAAGAAGAGAGTGAAGTGAGAGAADAGEDAAARAAAGAGADAGEDAAAAAAKAAADAAADAAASAAAEGTAAAVATAVPGLGEILGAGLLIGSLIGLSEHSERKPAPPQQPMGIPAEQTAFDAAPVIDSSQFHEL
tara:strand:+ start:1148 stop:2335 length:1188 start_codon:yes stop_codon:yes gene_type:complete